MKKCISALITIALILFSSTALCFDISRMQYSSLDGWAVINQDTDENSFVFDALGVTKPQFLDYLENSIINFVVVKNNFASEINISCIDLVQEFQNFGNKVIDDFIKDNYDYIANFTDSNVSNSGISEFSKGISILLGVAPDASKII